MRLTPVFYYPQLKLPVILQSLSSRSTINRPSLPKPPRATSSRAFHQPVLTDTTHPPPTKQIHANLTDCHLPQQDFEHQLLPVNGPQLALSASTCSLQKNPESCNSNNSTKKRRERQLLWLSLTDFLHQPNSRLNIHCLRKARLIVLPAHWISFHQFSTSNKPNKRYNHKNTNQ